MAFERLLEDLLHVMAFGELLYDEAALIVDALIDGYQGRARMLSLFEKIGYGSFHEEAVVVGVAEFPALWDQLAIERNALVHGKRRSNPLKKQPVDLECFAMSGLRLFAALHNRYNTESVSFQTVATQWLAKNKITCRDFENLKKK
jgi:hypothetical protein